MRPVYEHIDKNDQKTLKANYQKASDENDMDSMNDEILKKRESRWQRKFRLKSYQHQDQRERNEEWTDLKVLSGDSEDVSEQFEKLVRT